MNQLRINKLLIAIAFMIISVPLRAVVQPILPDEGVWNVVTRIAFTVDQITNAGATCDVLVSQADIGAGNSFVITSSNLTYCLEENISFSAGTAIEIQGSCITLDLNKHHIEGSGTGSYAIRITSGADNVTIKNGVVRDTMAFGVDGSDSALTNILIEDMDFVDTPTAIAFAPSSGNESDGLLIRRCRTFGACHALDFVGDSVIVQQCIFDAPDPIATAGPIVKVGGFDDGSLARHVILDDVLVTGTFSEPPGFGILVTFAQDAILRNSSILGVPGSGPDGGIRFTDCVNIHCVDSTVQDCNGEGFVIENTELLSTGSTKVQSATFIRCAAQQCDSGFVANSQFDEGIKNLKYLECTALNCDTAGFLLETDRTAAGSASIENVLMRNCVASSSGTSSGFVFLQDSPTAGTLTMSNVIVDGCTSQENGVNGFGFSSASASNTYEHFIFRNCVAQENTAAGFDLDEASVSTIDDIVFERCVAQRNGADGFDLGTSTTNVKVVNCCAMRNTGVGFSNSGSDNNFLLGNFALENTGGDITGLTDPNKSVQYTFAGAMLGAGRWVNART